MFPSHFGLCIAPPGWELELNYIPIHKVVVVAPTWPATMLKCCLLIIVFGQLFGQTKHGSKLVVSYFSAFRSHHSFSFMLRSKGWIEGDAISLSANLCGMQMLPQRCTAWYNYVLNIYIHITMMSWSRFYIKMPKINIVPHFLTFYGPNKSIYCLSHFKKISKFSNISFSNSNIF